VELKEPRIEVLVDHPDFFGTPEYRQHAGTGLIDTGATVLFVPWWLTARLGLYRITKRDVETASARHRAHIFAVVITLPVPSLTMEIEAASIPDATVSGVDQPGQILLGRSVL
jgi:predicted aspartyl protease